MKKSTIIPFDLIKFDRLFVLIENLCVSNLESAIKITLKKIKS